MIDQQTYILKLEEFIRKNKLNIVKIEPLTPDASTRRYFRLYFQEKKETNIAMVMGETDKKIVFEEIMEKIINFTELPYLNISRFLRKNGVRVPDILIENKDVLLIEDFGDTPLDVFVLKNGIQKALPYYENAIEELVKMQLSEPDKKCYAFELNFSKNMLIWEFDHFTEYFMGFHLKEDEIMLKEFSEISEKLSQTKYVFTHRDFHSKNLMCLDNYKVGILDFQDALLGPYVYDLVSLTADAYVDVPVEVEQYLKEKYKKLASSIITEDFEEIYSMCAAQRTLKAAGRFMYIFKVKNNKKFLPYVIPAATKGAKYLRKLGMKSAEKIENKIKELSI